MIVTLWIVFWLLVGSVIICTLYVLATYLLLAYDRLLAKTGAVRPPYDDHGTFPTKWTIRKAIFIEIVATIALAWVFLPAQIKKRSFVKGKGGPRPLLMIHGYNHNRSAFNSLKSRLSHAGLGPIFTLNLPRRNCSIQQYADIIAKEAERIEKKSGHSELILVGHSMGGLVCSYYAEQLAPLGKVSHVITIGSPLHGTRSAVLGGKTAARQMATGSETLRDINRAIAANQNGRYFHIASQLDNIIFPFQSSLTGLRPSQELLLSDVGHMALLFSPTVANQIINWLTRTVPARPEPIKLRREQPLTEKAHAS